MKKIIIMNHSVSDYNNWRPKFDQDETKREQAGIRTIDVLTDAHDENNVTAFFEVADIENFNAFVASPELQAGMAAAGVTSAPQIRILNSRN